MQKFWLLNIGIFIVCNVFAQEWDPYNFDHDVTVITQSRYNLLYSRIPNNMWLFVAPSKFEKKDFFELKVAAPSKIEKKQGNRYIITPLPDKGGLINFYIYKNKELIDSFLEITREPPTPFVRNYPSVSCRTGFYVPYVDYIKCGIDLNWRTDYELRVLSFQFIIKDTSGIVHYTKFVKGNKFSEDDKAKMKEVIDRLKNYLIDYMDVHVTDDKYYQATFSEVSSNISDPPMRFYTQE